MNASYGSVRTKEVPLTENPSSKLDGAVAAWNRWRGERLMPPWSDVELVELPPEVLPTTTVADVVRNDMGELDFVYRFWGTGFTRMHEDDSTGRSAASINPPDLAALVVASPDIS